MSKVHTMSLSLKDLDNYEKLLRDYGKEIPQKAMNIVDKMSDLGLQDNHKSTVKIPTKNEGKKITGGIKTTDVVDSFKEFGTGMIGSLYPHVPEFLAEMGWEYDVHDHGEKGWVYPKEGGGYGWTRGIAGNRKFYTAIKRMEKAFPDIAKQEFSKR